MAVNDSIDVNNVGVRNNEFRYDSNLLFIVDSSRLGGKYECHRFREYRIDIDLDADTASWQFVFRNPSGVYTSLFTRHDMCWIQLNGLDMLQGRVDKVEYTWDDDSSLVIVSGRDLAASLCDNDAIPSTKQNVKPIDYITSICNEYGIPKVKVADGLSICDKLTISTGESEMSVINSILDDDRKKSWYLIDTFYAGDWDTGAAPTYQFTRGVPKSAQGIPIKNLKLIEDGMNEISEVIVYGSTSSGENKVEGSAKNQPLIDRGIKRRSITGAHSNENASKYVTNAETDIKNAFRDGCSLEITIRTPKHDGVDQLILPNRTARVIDTVTRINSTMFIKNVQYSKTLESGSECTIGFVLGDQIYDLLWNNQGKSVNGGLSGFAKQDASAVVADVRG